LISTLKYNKLIIFSLNQSVTTKIRTSCHHFIENWWCFTDGVPEKHGLGGYSKTTKTQPRPSTKLKSSLKYNVLKAFQHQTKSLST
jgi:hypothetical protein